MAVVDRDIPPDPAAAITELGHRLDLARRRAGLTYRDLEARTGLPRSTLHHLLHGRKRLPDYWVLVGMVSALGGRWDEGGWEALWRRAADGRTPVLPDRAARGGPTPRQLPPALSVFTGRTAALAEIDKVTNCGGREPRVVGSRRSVVAIVGPGGIGKTSVALQWAHQHQDDFPDGQLFAALGGFGPASETISVDSVLASFLGALGVPPDSLPAAGLERAALLRTLLSGRRVLIVLDNARDSSHVLPLLPGTPGCTVLITSRVSLPTLSAQGAHLLPLDVLPVDEARALLARHIGDERLTTDPEATLAVLNRCAGLPLALAIVAARSSARPELPLAALAAELKDSATRLNALDAGEASADVRSVLSWSYRLLPPDQARLMRLLGAATVSDLGVEAIAALSGLSRAVASGTVRRLVDAHLVDEVRPARFGLHELVRLAATEWGESESVPPGEARDAITRLLEWLLVTADAADRQLAPERRRTLEEPIVAFHNYDEALSWCESEHHVFPAVARLAGTPDQLARAWRLPRVLWSFYRLGTDWTGLLDLATTGRDAALAIENGEGVASCENSLGIARGALGEVALGVDHIERALDGYRGLGDRSAERSALNNLGDLLQRQGELERSAECAIAAISICRELDDPYGECLATGNLGLALSAQGRTDEAMTAQRDALALSERIDDRALQVELLIAIGDLQRFGGQLVEATRTYRRAEAEAAEIGARKPHAAALTGLAEAARDTGDAAVAQAHATEARELLRRLSGADSEALADRIAAVTDEG